MWQAKDSVRILNQLLALQLTAINQYFLHARILKMLGELELADHAYKASIEAMRNADRLIDCILERGQLPDMESLGMMRIGHCRKDILRNDLQMVQEELVSLTCIAATCGDPEYTSLLETMLETAQQRVALIQSYMTDAQAA